MLYKINKGDSGFDAISVAARFRTKDETRYTYTLLNVSKGRIEATSGYACIRAKLKKKIKVGFYEVVRETLDTVWIVNVEDIHGIQGEDIRWPETDLVYKELVPCIRHKISIKEGPSSPSLIVALLYDKINIVLNYHFLSLIPEGHYEITIRSNEDYVIFKSKDYNIVIMPIKKDW